MSLCQCIVEDNLEEVQRLLEGKADVNAYEKKNKINRIRRLQLCLPLHTALYHERSTIIPVLLDYKADPHKVDDNHGNALSIAATCNYIKYVKMFVQMGVEYNTQQKPRPRVYHCDTSPLMLAIDSDAIESAIFLSNIINQDALLPFLVWLKKNKNLYHHYLFTSDALRRVAQLSKRQVVWEEDETSNQRYIVELK